MRPSDAANRHEIGTIVSSTGQLMCRSGTATGTNRAMGNTRSPEIRHWIEPATIFSIATSSTRDRGQHPVLDLAGVAELLHEGQRRRLDALEDDRRAEHAGDEQRGERGLRLRRGPPDALADLREHVGEDEHQEQRLEDACGG